MRALSPELIAQLYSQESNDPFLILMTLSHDSFEDDFRIVNNTKDIISNGKEYLAFPMEITLPIDDGETPSSVSLKLDNIGRELVDELRSIDTFVSVRIDLILASRPNDIQMTIDDLKLGSVSFNSQQITASLFLDNFLSTKMDAETYGPTNYRGIF